MITYVHPTLPIKFYDRVLREGSVDTRTYRYVVKHDEEYQVDLDRFVRRTRILRLPIKDLGTTAALDDWQGVYTELDR